MEESSFGLEEFSVEMEDFEITNVKKYDRIWRIEEGGSMCCAPLVHEGVVYIGACNHNLYAIDIETGKLKWKFKASNIFLESSPVYWEGKIFAGSFDRNMYAVDAETGKLMWKFEAMDKINSMPFIDGGRLYFASKDRNVYCLDARDGRLIWKYETQDEIPSSPTVKDGKVYIGSMDKNFYCLDAKTGAVVWKFATQGEVYHTNRPLVHRGVVYFSSFDNNLYAVTAEEGKLVWKVRTAQYGNSYSPILHNEMMYIPTRDGTLLAITLDGKIKWKFAKMYIPSIPAINNNRIYVGFEDYCLYCLDLKGNVMWKFETQGSVWLTIAFSGNKVIFPSWDCNLYCIDDKTQKIIWKFRTGGSPSYIPPANEEFEVVIKRPEGTTTGEGGREKRYDFRFGEEDNTSTYKSRITYQVSTQYASKGKYQVDSDEEAL